MLENTTAINTKEKILSILNIEVESLKTDKVYLERIGRVLDIISLTSGMWIELSYTYKAMEILERGVDICDEILRGDPHYKYQREAVRLKIECYRMVSELNAAKHFLEVQ